MDLIFDLMVGLFLTTVYLGSFLIFFFVFLSFFIEQRRARMDIVEDDSVNISGSKGKWENPEEV